MTVKNHLVSWLILAPTVGRIQDTHRRTPGQGNIPG